MKGKVLNVIKTQEPYEDQIEAPEPGQAVAELTEEDGESAGENQEQPQLQSEEEVKEMQNTEGTPLLEKTKLTSVELDPEIEQPLKSQEEKTEEDEQPLQQQEEKTEED